jgi:hypothetical protein
MMGSNWELERNIVGNRENPQRNPPTTPPPPPKLNRKRSQGTLTAGWAFPLAAWNFCYQMSSSPSLESYNLCLLNSRTFHSTQLSQKLTNRSRDHIVLNPLTLLGSFLLSRLRTLQEWLECGNVLRSKIMLNAVSHTLPALKPGCDGLGSLRVARGTCYLNVLIYLSSPCINSECLMP